MKKVLKFLIGIALLPACYSYTVEFARMLADAWHGGARSWRFTFWGAVAYLVVHFLFRKPMLVHVTGHELTHALFARLFGWKVKGMKASKNGGEVRLTGSNFIVTLAPYFFPIYTFATILLYIISIFLGYDSRVYPYFLFLTGFTLSLHIMMTIESMHSRQPDLKEGGFIFSIPLIYLGNLLFIALILKWTAFRKIQYAAFLKDGSIGAWGLWMAVYGYIYKLIN